MTQVIYTVVNSERKTSCHMLIQWYKDNIDKRPLEIVGFILKVRKLSG